MRSYLNLSIKGHETKRYKVGWVRFASVARQT